MADLTMKTIGIIGGIAWPSTTVYYRAINELTAKRMGGSGSHTAKLILIQTDFAEIEALQNTGDWSKLAEVMASLANRLQAAGADFFLIACNTMHLVAPQIVENTSIPMLHIVDAAARKIVDGGFKSVGLLGSRPTMSGEYFSGRLREKYGVGVVVPEDGEQEAIHSLLVSQLARGVFLDETRNVFKHAIAKLVERGAEAIVLGCTEFGMLVRQEDSPVPIIDTSVAHTEAAVDMALGN